MCKLLGIGHIQLQVKPTIYRTARKIQRGKPLIKWQNQKFKHIKLMDNNCHIRDLVQAFSNSENGGFNLASTSPPEKVPTADEIA